MTQLVLDTGGVNLALPESISGGYTCSNTPLFKDVTMASGRLTRELLGNVWEISYQYGYLDDAQKKGLITACEKGWREAIECAFLPHTSSGSLITSKFLVTSFTYPNYIWSRLTLDSDGPVPMWGDYYLTLREVRPHD
jgi:hypothetical protein